MWDLIYIIENGSGRMSLVHDDFLFGPHPAKEAGPLIVAEMVARGICESTQEAEGVYTFQHFANMTAGRNAAGQSYPYRIES